MFLKSGGALGPREADELELWEVAVLLQATYKTDKDSTTTSTTSSGSDSDRYRLIRERYAHERGEGPPPTVNPVDPAILESFKGAL